MRLIFGAKFFFLTYICIELRVLVKHVFKCCNYLSAHFSECILTMSFSKDIIFNIFYNYKTSCFSVVYDLPIEMQQSVLSHRFCKGMAFHQCGLLEGNSKWPLTIKAIRMVRLVKKHLHILTAIIQTYIITNFSLPSSLSPSWQSQDSKIHTKRLK